MCVLQSPMSAGIVQYIRKSFFGPKTWGGALTNFYWRRGATDPLLPLLRRLWSLSLPSMIKKRKEPQCSLRPASEHLKGGENINSKKKKKTIKNVLQSNSANGHRFTTASSQQRRTVHTITPCSFCHVNILIQNIVQALGVFYLYILFMIELPSWDTVSMNLAQ